jgi:thiamine biosynthesis lipoprotein
VEVTRADSLTTVRRARPLVGTFVAIEASGPPARARHLEAAVRRAFEPIALVDALMSPVRAGSDLARLRAARPGARVRVHPWTLRVLRAAKRWWRLSGGAFDPTAGGRARGTLADLDVGGGPGTGGRANDVFVRARLDLDLGGIAKGFAVDRAIACLRRSRAVRGACVNAGGDLRVFGEVPRAVGIRDAGEPGRLAARVRLANGALATSGRAFAPGPLRALIDPREGRRGVPHRAAVSATVTAPTCLAADALGKIALFAPPETARALLHRARAHAFRLDGARITVLS